MNSWTRYHPCIRWPGWSLAFFIGLTVWIGWLQGGMEIRSDATRLLSDDLRNSDAYAHVQKFLNGSTTLILIMDCGDQGVFHEDSLRVMKAVGDDFWKRSDVIELKSFTNSSLPYRDGFQLKFRPFLPPPPWSPATLKETRDFAVNHPLVRDLMVSQDGRQSILLVTFRQVGTDRVSQQAFREAIESTVEPYQNSSYKFTWVAAPLVEDEIRSAALSDARILIPCALVIWTATLGYFFRTWKALGFFLPLQLISLITVPWSFNVFGASLSAFSLSLFPALAGIQLTWLTHVFSGYRTALENNPTRIAAMGSCMTSIFQASLFAVLTTLAALGALAWMGPENSREFGKFGCIGSVILFLVTFGPGLSWAILVGGNSGIAGRSESNKIGLVNWAKQWANQDRNISWKWSLLVTVALAAFLIPGWMQVKTDVRAVDFLDQSSPTRQFAENMDQHLGGINLFQIQIDSGRPNGVNSLPFLQYLKSVQEHAESLPGVSNAYSYASVMEMIYQIWEQKPDQPPPPLQLPQSAFQLGVFSAAIRLQQSSFPFLNAVVDGRFRSAKLILRSHDMESGAYLDVIQSVIDKAEEDLPEGAKVRVSRGIHTLLEKDRAMARSQAQALGVTLAIIGVGLWILWRSLRLAVLALALNLAPILFALAIQGWLSIPLNSITAMSAALTFGIAIDDAVHFLTAWQGYRRQGEPNALALAIEQKTLPILCTTCTLAGIFALFTLSYFPPVRDLGSLTVLALLGAGGATLFVAPRLLRKMSE